MNEQQEIEIANKAELYEILRENDIDVEWKVTSDIGPEWIGSSTSFDFYLNDACVSNSGIVSSLIEAVKKAAKIPKSGGDRIIEGEGKLRLAIRS